MKQDVDEIFQNLDVNNDLYLEYEEFIRAAIDKSVFLTDKSLQFAFNLFDKGGKGEITIDDLISVISGDEVSQEEMDNARNMIDNIGSEGKIRFKEFKEIMIKFIGS